MWLVATRAVQATLSIIIQKKKEEKRNGYYQTANNTKEMKLAMHKQTHPTLCYLVADSDSHLSHPIGSHNTVSIWLCQYDQDFAKW